MYIEYLINHIDQKDSDLKTDLEKLKLNNYSKNILSIPYYSKLIKKNFPKLNVGCLVDYPNSFCDYDSRSQMIKEIACSDIDYMAITLPAYLLINRKYDKIREDIKKNLEMAKGKEIRYILEYRKFDHQILTKACEILLNGGINTIYPSTGFFIDNLEDNIIACTYLHKQTSINTIINGNAWTKSHCQNIFKTNLFGYSTNSISLLSLIKDLNEQ